MPDGTYTMPPLDTRLVDGLEQAHSWLAAQGWSEHCEAKPASLAIHWRGLPPPQAAALRDQVLMQLTPLAEQTGLVLHHFDGGLELRIAGRDKGFAVRTILAEIGDGAPVAYLGDDLTDEDAFVALKDQGLGVLVRPELRPTAADVWLRPPHELLLFLTRWRHASAS